MNSHSLSVILPTYNEAGHIVPLIREIITDCEPKEVIVVDDYSTDGTRQLAQSVPGKKTRVIVLSHAPPRSLTDSLRLGLHAATGTSLCWMDADFSHPPQLLPRLLSQLHTHDVAVASTLTRLGRDGRSDRRAVFFSLIINKLCQWVFGTSVRQYTSGYIMVRRQVIDDVPLTGDYGEYCIDFLVRCQKRGWRICEVPYSSDDRRTGTSKTATSVWGFFFRGRKYIWTIVRLSLGRNTHRQIQHEG